MATTPIKFSRLVHNHPITNHWSMTIRLRIWTKSSHYQMLPASFQSFCLIWNDFCHTAGLVCWSLMSLCHSNGHIETMPARQFNPFTVLTRIRSQFLRTQWRAIISKGTRICLRPLSHRGWHHTAGNRLPIFISVCCQHPVASTDNKLVILQYFIREG
jgi:hypothetical protein